MMETADLAGDTIGILNDSLSARHKKLYVDQVANALVGPVLQHPEVNGGAPYTLTQTQVMEGYAKMLGGGKSLFKVAAVMDCSKFGTATAKTRSEFAAAGFVAIKWATASKKRPAAERNDDSASSKQPRLNED